MSNHARKTNTAGLLGTLGLALLLVGCGDQQPVAPHSKLKVEAGNNSVLTVNSEITLYDKGGRERKYTRTQQLQTQMVAGVVRATVVAPGGGARASMQVNDSSAQAAGYTAPLTPVVGVRYGSGVANYTLYVTDTTTMKIYKVVATGPMTYNSPIDVASAYDSRGSKIAEIHYKWSKVSGGYALLAQKELSYSSTGVLAASVTSYVSAPVTYVAMAETPAHPAGLGSILHSVTCFFGPQVAYAQGKVKGGGGGVVGNSMPLPGSSCSGEGGVLAINIGIIGVESATEMELWELPLYLGSWTALGHSLWHYLDCLDGPPRCTASTCTGGGGTSW